MKQSDSSTTHARQLAAGLTIIAQDHRGEGDSAVSFIRYSDGSTWHFDNGSATRLGTLYGYAESNRSQEPSWFTTEEAAREFNRHCGGIFGDPETVEADSVNLLDILN